MTVSPRAIPPSSAMKEKIQLAQQSPKNGRRKRGLGHSSTFLWLNGICLIINITLMIVLFVFHANWMPKQANSVQRAHSRNRKEFFNLMRGLNKDGSMKSLFKEVKEEIEEELPRLFRGFQGDADVEEAAAEEEVHADDTPNKEAEEEEAEDNNTDNANDNNSELPYTLNNSPNSDDYDISKQQYHVIFSTGCSAKQHWQSYMLYYSIVTSGQTGQATRIASGCTDEEAKELKKIHKEQIEPMGRIGNEQEASRFHLHLTPEFGKDFHYNNKPYGVAHWMENVLGYSENQKSTNHDDTLLMLLDPDMILMRPFVNDFAEKEMWLPRTSYPRITRVKHGYPMASVYGYGNQWFHKTNITKIVGKSPMMSYTKEQIDENYHAGPPYVSMAKDFYQIVSTWRMLANPVHEQYPFLLSEMFAYSLAAAHLELPHQLAQSFMVSDWKEPGVELATKNTDVTPGQMCRHIPTETKPHILHYCQRLALGKYLMSKHRLPDDFVGQDESCGKPLLAEPPDDFAVKYDYFIDVASGKRHDIRDAANGRFTGQEKINQAAFLLCEELQAFNRGATYFKEHHCDEESANMQKTFLFFDSTELTEAEKNQKGETV